MKVKLFIEGKWFRTALSRSTDVDLDNLKKIHKYVFLNIISNREKYTIKASAKFGFKGYKIPQNT